MTTILLLIVVLATANVETREICTEKLDILVHVDGYSTICNGNEPCPEWYAILKFFKDMVNSLTIGIKDTRVACITFSNTTNLEWNLLNYTDKASLNRAIDNVKYTGGEYADLPSVLRVIGGIFNPQLGDRKNVQNILIKITDGEPSNPDEDYAAAADEAQANGIAIFVVCDRPGCTEHHAKTIAAPPKKVNETYFLIDDYLKIGDIRDNLVKKFCAYKTKDLDEPNT